MAYINCAWCPAQSFLYGHHGYCGFDMVYEEYRCVSGHKTFIEREYINGNRVPGKPEEDSGYGC
jgi:hypothetical protein